MIEITDQPVFVLDIAEDQFAIPALAAYAKACSNDYPALAADLNRKIAAVAQKSSEFVIVPEVTLPNGTTVPSFKAGKFLSSRGAGDTPVSVATAAPWVNINYSDARAAAARAGLQVLTETQALAIAHDIAAQDINWTGGKVGEGSIFMGLHTGSVSEPQPGTYESSEPDERRWHELSNGERIFDFAGNAFTWVFDDVHGDENGLIARRFDENDVSLNVPYPSMEKGVGWRPNPGADWSGRALVRGGCWCSGRYAGVFYLDRGWPDDGSGYLSFRCTQPLGL